MLVTFERVTFRASDKIVVGSLLVESVDVVAACNVPRSLPGDAKAHEFSRSPAPAGGAEKYGSGFSMLPGL